MEEYKCRDGADHLAAGPGPGQRMLARFRGGAGGGEGPAQVPTLGGLSQWHQPKRNVGPLSLEVKDSERWILTGWERNLGFRSATG